MLSSFPTLSRLSETTWHSTEVFHNLTLVRAAPKSSALATEWPFLCSLSAQNISTLCPMSSFQISKRPLLSGVFPLPKLSWLQKVTLTLRYALAVETPDWLLYYASVVSAVCCITTEGGVRVESKFRANYFYSIEGGFLAA